ncbi:MAG: cohesin domain-containing protein, partial [Anaerolineae bacterium]
MISRVAGRLTVWLVTSVTLLLLLVPATPAQPTTIISFEPAAVSFAPGESTRITVAITGASLAYGFEAHIAFDPTILQVVDQDPDQAGIQILSGGFFDENEGFLITNQADNTTGEIDYALTLLAPALPREGDGALLFLTFRAIGVGQSQVVLDSALVASTDGDSLPFTVENGQVDVAGESGATAVPSTPTVTDTTIPSGVPPTETEPAPTPAQTPSGTPDGWLPTSTQAAITASATVGGVQPTVSDTPAIAASATAGGVQPTVSDTPAIEPESTEGTVIAQVRTPTSLPATSLPGDMSTGTPSAAAIGSTDLTPTRTALPAPTMAAGRSPSGERTRSGFATGWLWAGALLVVVAVTLAA